MKRRLLIIGHNGFSDLVTVDRLLKRVWEDFKKYDKGPGRHNFIGYSARDPNTDKFLYQVAVWYTATQITFYFSKEEEPNGEE